MGAKRTVKVAVVGSGLAGLTSAYLLATFQPRPANIEFDIHIFEKVSLQSCMDASVNPIFGLIVIGAWDGF
jgi:2-polyprenyl-6-methoxyphenol hydroxylase-like FAD-dependent oxidoreductase